MNINTNITTVLLSEVPDGHVIIRLPAGSAGTPGRTWRSATTSAPQDWDKDVNHDELLTRLASLNSQTAQTTPILDDDDLEAAIDDAADRLTSD